MDVPFVDLKAQHNAIRQELDEAIKNILDNTAFVLGDAVEEFEQDFAGYCDAKHCVGVGNGTQALHLALLAHGIKQGDEVVTVPNSFIATAEAISHAGAKPVFVDINAESYTMDAGKLEQAITENTKAIVPVHLYGQPADMKPIMEIAEKKGITIVEDCCQAHGAEYNGKKVPVSGTGCFSFYPAKNLGAIGEGGALVSDNEEVYEKAKVLRAHGESPKNVHSVIGFNYRMEGIQGAVLGVKLKHLDKWIEARRKNAKEYDRVLDDANVVKRPVEQEYAKHAYHLYEIQAEKRDELREFLEGKGIHTGIHYPTPIHLQPAYSSLGLKEGSFPAAEAAMKRIVSLPIFAELTVEQIAFVVEQLKQFYSG